MTAYNQDGSTKGAIKWLFGLVASLILLGTAALARVSYNNLKENQMENRTAIKGLEVKQQGLEVTVTSVGKDVEYLRRDVAESLTILKRVDKKVAE